MSKVVWDIEDRAGPWQLLWSDDERLTLLALLLDNIGIDRAIRLGDPAEWRSAVAELK